MVLGQSFMAEMSSQQEREAAGSITTSTISKKGVTVACALLTASVSHSLDPSLEQSTTHSGWVSQPQYIQKSPIYIDNPLQVFMKACPLADPRVCQTEKTITTNIFHLFQYVQNIISLSHQYFV